MAEEKKDPIVLTQCLAPVPQPKRGYGYSISSFSGDDGDYMCYTNGTNVILRDLADPNQASIFGGHKGKVNCGAFSHSGEFVASADENGEVIIWGRKNLIQKYSHQGVKGCYDISWSSDDSSILMVGIGSGPANASLIDVAKGKAIAKVNGHNKPVLSASFGKDSTSIISCSEDMSVRFRCGEGYTVEKTNRKVHDNYVNSVKFSPNGEFAASVSSDKKIAIYAADFSVIKEIPNAHKGSIYSVSWSPCSKYLLTASADKTAKIWDVESGKSTKTFTWKNDLGNMQMSALWHEGKDQQYLVTVSLNGAINFLDQESGEFKTVSGIQETPTAFGFDSVSKSFYIGDRKGGLSGYSNDEGWRIATGKGPSAKYKDVVVNCNGELVWAMAGDNKMYTVECKEMKYTGALNFGTQATSLAASKTNPSMVAVGLNNKKVLIVKDGDIVSETSVPFIPWRCEFSPDDKRLAIAAKAKKSLVTYDFDGTSKLTNCTEIYKRLQGAPTRIQFASRTDLDANYISCSTMRGQIVVFQDGQTKIKNNSMWQYHSGAVTSHSWNPSGKLVSSVSQDQCLFVWHDTVKFKKKYKSMDRIHLKGGLFTNWIDETNVLSVGSSGAVKIWQVNL